MRFSSIAFALSLAVSACASSQSKDPVVPQNGNTSNDPNMDCRTERPIGSSIPRTTCEPVGDRERERDSARNSHSSASPRLNGQ